MYFVFILGTAGAGKSYLTSVLAEWFETHELQPFIVNLDPAAEWLPYSPDFDVRNYVNTRTVMEKFGLGPNGALIASVDMLINNVEDIREAVIMSKANYVLVDTPGQLELFAFRHSGPLIVRSMCEGFKSAALYLIDSFFTSDPSSFASALLLSISTQLRLKLPQLNILSKSDLISENTIERVLEWIEDPMSLASDIASISPLPPSETYGITIKLAEIFKDIEVLPQIVPSSSRTWEGLDDIYRFLQLIFAGGEDFITEEPSGKL